MGLIAITLEINLYFSFFKKIYLEIVLRYSSLIELILNSPLESCIFNFPLTLEERVEPSLY